MTSFSLRSASVLLAVFFIFQFFACNTTFTVTPSGTFVSISPDTAQKVSSLSTQSFTVTANSGYTLSTTVGGTCSAGSWSGSIYTTGAIEEDCTVVFSADSNSTTGTTTLSTSSSTLALSVTGLTLDGDSSGQARIITISNTGSETATSVSISYPTWPSGTTASSTCGSTLEAGKTCTITVTPGATATSNCNTGIAPTPGVITVSAENVENSVTSNVVVLNYGCIYQGGYVFSMTENPTLSENIGGAVVAVTDQATQGTPVIWSSDSSGVYDNGVSIWGIDETSTAVIASPNASSPEPATLYVNQNNCEGNSEGVCNQNNIYVYYQSHATGAPIPLTDYAAGLCANYQIDTDGNSPCQTGDCYADWYLPAICQMGYDGRNENDGCGTIGSPTLQNIETNLVNNGNIGSLAPASGDNYYWSSTEWSGSPSQYAWYQLFNLDQSSLQVHDVAKNGGFGVRCVRGFIFH